MLFRLKKKCGDHAQDGKIYKSGDIVETDIDLCALFRNKFERAYEQELKDTGKEDTTAKKPNIPSPLGKDDEVVEEIISDSLPKDEVETEEAVSDFLLEDDEPDKNAEDETEHGKDVTSEFPTAVKLRLKVFEKSKWYVVVDVSDGSVLNVKKLREKEVQSFIEQYLE